MSREVGAGGRLDIFLDSAKIIVKPKLVNSPRSGTAHVEFGAYSTKQYKIGRGALIVRNDSANGGLVNLKVLRSAKHKVLYYFLYSQIAVP